MDKIDNGPGVVLSVLAHPDDAEFAAAHECGCVEVALGANILRTETAVCAALAAVQYAFGAFRKV